MQTLPNLYVEVGWRRGERGESREGRDREVPFVGNRCLKMKGRAYFNITKNTVELRKLKKY
jgi:hypothetical protein